MGSFALVCIPVRQDVLEATLAICQHALVVDGDGDNIQTSRPCGLNGVHVGEFFTKQTLSFADPVSLRVPDVAKGLDGFGEAIGRADGQNDFSATVVGDIGVEVFANKFTNEAVEGWVTLGSSIL